MGASEGQGADSWLVDVEDEPNCHYVQDNAMILFAKSINQAYDLMSETSLTTYALNPIISHIWRRYMSAIGGSTFSIVERDLFYLQIVNHRGSDH